MTKEKTTKEKLIEEFENKYSSFELCNQISKPELDKLKNFLSQAINQTREETIREILNKLPKQQVIEAIVDADNDLTKSWVSGFNNCLNQIKSLINK